MEQEHGTDAAAICKGVLLRVRMAAAMSTAVLGFLLYHVLPRLRENGLPGEWSPDADAQNRADPGTARPAGHLLLCVYPLIGHGKKPRGCGGRDLHRSPRSSLLGAGMVYGSRENGDPAARGLRVPCSASCSPTRCSPA